MTTVNTLCAKLRKGLVLTTGERLVVHRRKRKMTQSTAAGVFGVGVDKLRAWENDFQHCPRVVARVKMADLPLSELLRIRRERLNLRIAYLARVMEKSVGWVHRAHTGEHIESAERLADFILTKEKRA